MTTMSYSVDSKDWTRPGVGGIVQAVVGAAFPGAVVGMHDGGGDRSETVAALPQIMTGLQVALPVSMIVTIVTEMLMAGQGLGGAMIEASRFADSAGVFAGIVEIAVAGLCLVKGMAALRRRLMIWHQEAQEPTTC